MIRADLSASWCRPGSGRDPRAARGRERASTVALRLRRSCCRRRPSTRVAVTPWSSASGSSGLPGQRDDGLLGVLTLVAHPEVPGADADERERRRRRPRSRPHRTTPAHGRATRSAYRGSGAPKARAYPVTDGGAADPVGHVLRRRSARRRPSCSGITPAQIGEPEILVLVLGRPDCGPWRTTSSSVTAMTRVWRSSTSFGGRTASQWPGTTCSMIGPERGHPLVGVG